jgi:hypothetical protein
MVVDLGYHGCLGCLHHGNHGSMFTFVTTVTLFTLASMVAFFTMVMIFTFVDSTYGTLQQVWGNPLFFGWAARLGWVRKG